MGKTKLPVKVRLRELEQGREREQKVTYLMRKHFLHYHHDVSLEDFGKSSRMILSYISEVELLKSTVMRF